MNKKRLFLRPLSWFGLTISTLFTFVFLILAFTPIGNLTGNILRSTTEKINKVKKADYIVVLGGRVERAVDAARLYHKELAPQVILSGGLEDHWSALLLCGIPEEALSHDKKAERTSDHPHTILELPEVDKTDRFIIVTSDLHHYRSQALFEAAGYEHLQFFKYRSSDSSNGIGLGSKGAITAMYELAAIVKEKLTGKL